MSPLWPPLVNVAWSATDAVGGAMLLGRSLRSTGQVIAATIGAIGVAAVLAWHFGDARLGGIGLRGARRRRVLVDERTLI
ncbi:hypothetical protein LG315_07750 [Microbacterium marinum]|uniref:hypothetical protein n=1 Tax=Microbacterium marinum TaxID=421115 RepID=UPI00384F3858